MAQFRLQKSLLALSIGLALVAQAQAAVPGQSEALARLSADTGYTAQVSMNSATGAARFVRAAPGGKLSAAPLVRNANNDAARQANALQFLSTYGGVFGISNPGNELVTRRTTRDSLGNTHISHQQVYQGVPVFAAELKSHFDADGNLTVVNGTFIPGITLSTTPTRTAAQAASVALARVKADLNRIPVAMPTAQTPTLVIYREGLAKGVEGENHLAWRVEVTNRADVRDFVFVSAVTGKVIDKIGGIHEAMNRRAFNSAGQTAPGPNYPSSPFWVEGQGFPTGTVEADNMIAASGETYSLFKNAFGRDSYDGNGATMDSIFNRGNGCPNASWNGSFISFCPGTTTDDVTAHEWAHAYTEYTHGLIYQWQPGALNEAYSDIWGETIDRLNGRGGDTPDALRTGACTSATPAPPTVTILSPASIAGPRTGGGAAFGPTTFSISGSVVGVDVGSTSAGCVAPFANAAAVAGNIAFIDRGTCGFAVKVKNAQLAGAIGVIIGNNAAGAAPALGGADATVTIPSLSVTQADGTAMKAQFATSTTVTASLVRGGNGADASVRWLVGEDSSAFGGAIRDMYNPTCYGNPGKVSDPQYTCSTADSGGVHGNSGVPNHAYALLVDGGTYNGQTVGSIGLTKAAHIYYRAQSVYQGPASNFADHADALTQSCVDLTGVNLADLKTGTPSGQVITAADCGEIAKAALAVELRTPPSQCNFVPLLAKNPPALCATGAVNTLASDSFDGGKRVGMKWLVTNAAPTADFKPADFGVVSRLPSGRPGYGIFVPDANVGTCAAGSDATSEQHLVSPEITIPAGTTAPRMSFDHWIATEAGYDGGNVQISVNGGAWTLVSAANFIYNGYNSTLIAAGNTNPLAGQAALHRQRRRLGEWFVGPLDHQPGALCGGRRPDQGALQFRQGRLRRHLRLVHRRRVRLPLHAVRLQQTQAGRGNPAGSNRGHLRVPFFLVAGSSRVRCASATATAPGAVDAAARVDTVAASVSGAQAGPGHSS